MVSCYFSGWSRYRPGNGSYNITDLLTTRNLCTHWIYASEGILNNGTIVSLDSYLDNDLGNNIHLLLLLSKTNYYVY